MELLRRGAEATLCREKYLGMEVLVKDRTAKDYREKRLDDEIRKLRTKEEVFLIRKARERGVRTPVVYKVDRKGSRIVMEYIKGERLKDVLGKENIGLCRSVGENIARMHKAGIIHGDLTTSNILLHNGVLVFIDFGLGFFSGKDEDKAVDLLVFKKTFMATHFALGKGWGEIVKGYEKVYGKEGEKIVGRIAVIEKRGRYL